MLQAKMLCNYIFPFDPVTMFRNSPPTMTKDTRFLRLTMMKMIAEYSLSHDQTETNTNIIIDIDARGYIIGILSWPLYPTRAANC